MGLLTATDLPERFAHVLELDEFLTRPSEALVEDLLATPGDIMVIGVVGRMGPSLARLAHNAAPHRRVIGVGNFGDANHRMQLENKGIETIACDLLDEAEVAALPVVDNVIFMAGRRFDPAREPPLTWAVNTLIPASVARRFHASRIVAFSTGDIYPSVPPGQRGASERTEPAPEGEIAQSSLGRERIFEYYSARHDTPGRLLRLHNPADTRYGAIFDIACRVESGQPVDVTAGHLNVIWQGDAASMALRALRHVTTPTTPLNIGGPETLPVRWVATELGRRMGREPSFVGTEAATARLMDTATANGLFGYPIVPVSKILDWTADWVLRSMPHFGRPTDARS